MTELTKADATKLLDWMRDHTHTNVWPAIEELGDYITLLEQRLGKRGLAILATIEDLKRVLKETE